MTTLDEDYTAQALRDLQALLRAGATMTLVDDARLTRVNRRIHTLCWKQGRYVAALTHGNVYSVLHASADVMLALRALALACGLR